MNSTSIRKAFCAAACVITAAASTSALATAHLEVQASAIQIQNNGSTNPSLFYTGSVCSAQHLNLDDNSSVDVQKLLWASVLSAKANGSKMSFDYDYNGDICVIRSFAVMPN
ncbi:hypothetical protein KCV01_g2451, partial [Aureobasidium melanogenum]